MKHEDQHEIWEREHQSPTVLLQMDSHAASGGVQKFWDFLVSMNAPRKLGLEMGCGKGRNVIWLAKQGVEMQGFDFSTSAIAEARKRADEAGVSDLASFAVADATEPWPFESSTFDFGVDCFATTDIESSEGRAFAISEMRRVLKPRGYLLAYLLSIDDEFHKEMIAQSPAEERNAFLHPSTGKFEKTYDEDDIASLYEDFEVVRKERIEKTTEFFNKEYNCKHFWLILQKPA